mgnify:FL=1
MTTYRFRLNYEHETEPFWRDIDIGADRTLAELGAAIVDATALDEQHLWFFGINQTYWASPVKYLCHREYASLSSGGPMWWDEDVFDAAETSVGMLGLDQWDALCFLCDYVNDRRFYVVLQEIRDDDENPPPTVVDERGRLPFAGDDGTR